jgi:hypothetical protein
MTFLALFLHISTYFVDVKDVGFNDNIYSYSIQMWPMFETVTTFLGVSDESRCQCRQSLDVVCNFSIIDTWTSRHWHVSPWSTSPASCFKTKQAVWTGVSIIFLRALLLLVPKVREEYILGNNIKCCSHVDFTLKSRRFYLTFSHIMSYSVKFYLFIRAWGSVVVKALRY